MTLEIGSQDSYSMALFSFTNIMKIQKQFFSFIMIVLLALLPIKTITNNNQPVHFLIV